jgi:DNA-binding transcriptional regulator PaaX
MKLSEITVEILETLKDLGQLFPQPFESKREMVLRLKKYNRREISQGLYNLKRNGWVKLEKKGKKRGYVLTDLGRAKSLQYAYRLTSFKRRTDGFSTIVLFDVPEKLSPSRRFLRRFLVQNGFTCLQESVFIGPYVLAKGFKDILKELKISDCVSVLEGRVINSVLS